MKIWWNWGIQCGTNFAWPWVVLQPRWIRIFVPRFFICLQAVNTRRVRLLARMLVPPRFYLSGLLSHGYKRYQSSWYFVLRTITLRRSEKSTLSAVCSDTPNQLQSDECVLVVPLVSNKVSIDGILNSGDPLQWRCLNKDLVVVLSSLHTNRNKMKGSEDFNWNNIGLASLWFVWFCRHVWFRLRISCRLVIRTC